MVVVKINPHIYIYGYRLNICVPPKILLLKPVPILTLCRGHYKYLISITQLGSLGPTVNNKDTYITWEIPRV